MLLAYLAAVAVGVPTMSAAAPRQTPNNAPADQALFERLCLVVSAAYDSARGGFVTKAGEPHEAAIELMLARGRDGYALARERALRTLVWTRMLLDTVGGGYVNGTRDKDPKKAFLDKGTIPNARRLELLTQAWDLTKDGSWKRDARFVVDYFERVLLDPRGGFYTGQTASVDLEPESNGIALQAWWRWAALTASPERRSFALRSQARLWRDCRLAELGFARRTTFGELRGPALLPDQVEMGRAHLYAWSATGRDSELTRAREVAAHVLSKFRDPVRGSFRLEYADERFGHGLRARRPFEDNARAARFLVELGRASGDTADVNAARRAWAEFDREFDKSRMDAAEWALAVRALWSDDLPARSKWREGKKPAMVAKPAKAAVRKRRR
ncbi:MAG: hypothetical protein ABIR01_05855 [Candidatus Eisenbacteria bacterium]